MMRHIERAYTPFIDRFSLYERAVLKNLDNYEVKNFPLHFEQRSSTHGKIPSNMIHTLHNFNSYFISSEADRSVGVRLLNYHHTLAKAFFKLAFNEGQEVAVNFTGKPVKHIGRSYTYAVGFRDWLNAWGVFAAYDDREGLELLQSIPEKVMDNADLKWPYLHKSMFSILKNMYNEQVDMGELFVEAMKATDPLIGGYRNDREAEEWVLYNYEPLIRVYYALFKRDEKEFNEVLTEALELHKKYWGDAKSKRNLEIKGWISWKLIAPAALAQRLGMKLEVTSDYIPQWIVNGEGLNKDFLVKEV